MEQLVNGLSRLIALRLLPELQKMPAFMIVLVPASKPTV